MNPEHSSPKRDHTYVALSQEPDSNELNNDLDGQDAMDEKIEVNSNVSDTSVGHNPVQQVLTESQKSDFTMKLFSAFLYGISSFIITVINKIVLTTYKFPSASLLGVGQIIAILIILNIARQFNAVTIRMISLKNRKIRILASIYFFNLISGLGGTKSLPLPMFIALRRFSIAMTAIGEFFLLHIKQSLSIIMTIVAMIGGSFIAAAADLTFNAIGYALVMTSNFFTAANVVFIKKTIDSKEINKHEILYYSALLSLIPAILVCVVMSKGSEIRDYPFWYDLGFLVSFVTSCVMGYILMFSTVLCTHHNSPLTTTIVGTLKNIMTTYVGMYIGGDYRFSALNFIGINISLVGSLVYSYLTFRRTDSKGLIT